MKPTVRFKTLLLLTGCFIPWLLRAQAGYNKEIGFTTENDAYLFHKNDAYYTNGIFLHYLKAGSRNGKKRVHAFDLGQAIYTPLKRQTVKASDIDRPYAGYLYAGYNQALFPNKQAVLQYGASVGVVGPPSLGEDMQNWYHGLLDYSRFSGWHYQVQSAFGADLHFSYARTVAENGTWLKFMPVGEAKLGSNFTNASIGAITVAGRFSPNANSALWNARVQEKGATGIDKAEIFFYWYPQVIIQGYNATVQGGLFAKSDTVAVLGNINRWMFQQTIGACFAKARWTIKAAYTYQTREAVAQINPHWYGSFRIGYRIH